MEQKFTLWSSKVFSPYPEWRFQIGKDPKLYLLLTSAQNFHGDGVNANSVIQCEQSLKSVLAIEGIELPLTEGLQQKQVLQGFVSFFKGILHFQRVFKHTQTDFFKVFWLRKWPSMILERKLVEENYLATEVLTGVGTRQAGTGITGTLLFVKTENCSRKRPS